MVFPWSLSDSKSPQVSRTLLSILADLNNAVVWMVSTHSLISKSSSPFTYPLVTVPLLCSIVFFSSLARSRYLSLFSLSLSFTLQSARIAKSTTWQVFFSFGYHHHQHHYYYYYHYYYFTPCKFLPPELAGGLLQESE